MKTNRFLILIALAQTLLAIRVIWRLVRTAGGERIEPPHYVGVGLMALVLELVTLVRENVFL